MNLLAVGGLLALGVLALVALVFVIRDGSGKETNVSVLPPIPAEQEVSTTHPVADESSTVTQSTPELDQSAAPIAEELPVDEWHQSTNGQYYEIVNELRNVRGQVRELEHRLSELVDMVERDEHNRDKHISDAENVNDVTEIRATS